MRYFAGQEISNERIQDLKNAGGWTNDWAVSHRLIGDLGFDIDYGAVVAQFQTVFLGQDDDGLMRREKWVARPGLLERLSQRYDLAVFTGRTRQEARITLDRSARGLTFHPVISADDVAHGKPAPDGLLDIAAITGATRMWYVGDTVDDARSAKAAHVPFIGIAAANTPRRAELQALFAAEGAVHVLEDINQLEGVI